jgi:hypothetical protein
VLHDRAEALERFVIEWAPRVLGVAPMAVVFVALCRCVGRTHAVVPLAVEVALSGIAFGTFVVTRRRMLKVLGRTLEGSAKHPFVASLWEDIDAFRIPSKRAFHELPYATRVVLLAHLGVFVLFVVLFAGWPIAFAQWLGAQTILVLALATWIVACSWAAYVSSWLRVPGFLVLAAWALLVSPCTDDHGAARGPSEATRKGERPRVDDDFSAWRTETAADPGTPFVVVATEGGGIRAAYWTAAMLAALQDTDPTFASHVYAISSVSGGSVGAAVFDAVVEARPSNHRNAAGAILSTDSLAPALARMLYPDLLQRFLPFVMPGADRGEALAESWTVAVSKTMPASRFFERALDGPFWDAPTLPRLYLNSTWVETGKRVVLSRPRVEPKTFEDVEDGEALANLSVADAVLASARFPYVSPAQTVPAVDGGGAWGHLVDGGYFENSGAQTASEILSAVGNPGDARVILLRYDDGKKPAPTRWATEVTSPPYALYDARNAREALAVAALKERLPAWAVADLVLRDANTPLPLGWMLSAEARTDINARVDQALAPGQEGRKVLDWWSRK